MDESRASRLTSAPAAPWRDTALARPALVGLVLLLGVVGALVVAERIMGAPRADVEQLALFLTISGGASLLGSAGLVRWLGARARSLRVRLGIAFGAGLLVALVNILGTSALMFLSPHDLSLLLLLLGFAALLSLSFAYATASLLTRELERLADAAAALARGDLSVRVAAEGADEVARLGQVFDQMAASLQAAFERQQRLEASRRDLVAAVSHDLRTPLATTRAMVEAITDGVVSEPDEVQRYLGLIGREIQHLARLIDDLFELSQVESGTLKLQVTAVDLVQLAGETAAAYQAWAADRGVQLACTCAGQAEVQADSARLQRVLRNLLDNALRHTPSGGTVRIETRIEAGWARLTVSDSGPGISPADWERVFERFYRGERSRHRAEGGPLAPPGGAGLGLAIARAIVEAHGGRIWADRSDLGGAALHVSLPASPAAG